MIIINRILLTLSLLILLILSLLLIRLIFFLKFLQLCIAANKIGSFYESTDAVSKSIII